MASLVRCKACGYIMEESRLNSNIVCPLCGVSKNMFEPYQDPVSENRRKLLKLHLHPMIVHFPQAFSSTMLFLTVLVFFFDTTFTQITGGLRQHLLTTVRVLAVLLPLSLIAAFISGIIDAVARYKRIHSPYLFIKITVGTIYTFLSFIYIPY